MTKNPLVNGITASAYIVLVATVMNVGSKMGHHPDTFLAPIAVISLFTFSAAVMAYVFCYEPIQLFIGGKKKQGLNLFLQTTLVFGVLTALALALLFAGF